MKFKYNPGDKIGPYSTLFLERLDKVSGKYRGRFKCSFCGKEFIVSDISSISTGNTKSCGCQKIKAQKENGEKSKKDYTGFRYGHITYIEPTNQRYNKSVIWHGKCDCGNDVYHRTGKIGEIKSCGKCSYNRSHGELEVEKILNKYKINFLSEYKFIDCFNPETNYPLRFDFYLPNYNCCIEYDGIQHFKQTSYSHENFDDRKNKDNIKTQYCINNKIKLIRIPYKEYKNIEQILKEELKL